MTDSTKAKYDEADPRIKKTHDELLRTVRSQVGSMIRRDVTKVEEIVGKAHARFRLEVESGESPESALMQTLLSMGLW